MSNRRYIVLDFLSPGYGNSESAIEEVIRLYGYVVMELWCYPVMRFSEREHYRSDFHYGNSGRGGQKFRAKSFFTKNPGL